jgi:hypothetical protein
MVGSLKNRTHCACPHRPHRARLCRSSRRDGRQVVTLPKQIDHVGWFKPHFSTTNAQCNASPRPKCTLIWGLWTLSSRVNKVGRYQVERTCATLCYRNERGIEWPLPLPSKEDTKDTCDEQVWEVSKRSDRGIA